MMTTTSNQACLEAIQSNETDIIVSTVHLPLHPNLTNIRQGQVGGEYNTVITSFYDSDVGSLHHVDVLDTFYSFSPEIWLLVISMLAVIGGLLVVSFVFKSSFTRSILFHNTNGMQTMLVRNRRKQRKEKIADNICQTLNLLLKGFLNKDDSLSNPFSRKGQPWSQAILRVSLCFFMFWILFFFTSMVKTELVTVRTPETINIYQDILKKKDMIPFFLQSTTDFLIFRDSPRNSDAGKIWTRIRSQEGGCRNSLLEGPKFIAGLVKMFKMRTVMISTREREYAVRTFNCKFKSVFERVFKKKELHSLRSWTSGDPSATPVLRGFVFNLGFNDRKVEDRLRSQFEHGFEQHIYATVALDLLKSPKLIQYNDTSPLDEKRDCLGDTVQKPWPSFTQPLLENFRKLFIYQFFIGLCIAFGSLLLEFAICITKKFVGQNRMKCDEARISSSFKNRD